MSPLDGMHWPIPLHTVSTFSSLPKQDWGSHTCDEPGNVHAFGSCPSHTATHASKPAVAQAGLPRRGGPLIVVHTPPMTSQVWHWPVHAESQQ